MGPNVTLEGSLLFPSEYLCAADLAGKDVTVEIARVEMAELRMQGGVSKKKPLVHFAGKKKKLVLNKTNAGSIAKAHGGAVEGWTGKSITLYPTRVRCGPDMVDAIRVRESSAT